jgi:hypothetical protein
MNESMSVLIQIPFNKLVLKKKYMIETNGSVFTGTFYYMFGPTDVIGDMFGLGQPCFIDVNPTIKGSMLICTAYDKFYDLKVKTE